MANQALSSPKGRLSDIPEAEFLALLGAHGAYKDRSDSTHDSTHLPELSSRFPVDDGGKPIDFLLLGTSMLERFKTTGSHTFFATAPGIFNAGVGGDRIRNVVFRLGEKDLYGRLKERGFKTAIIQMGTNDLRPKKGLTAEALHGYALTLQALRRTGGPGLRILVAGIMRRKDIPDAIVEESNEKLKALADAFDDDKVKSTFQCVLCIISLCSVNLT